MLGHGAGITRPGRPVTLDVPVATREHLPPGLAAREQDRPVPGILSSMRKKKAAGRSRIIRAAIYSCQGLVACYKTEEAFRQELALAAVLLPLGLWLGDTGVERALLAGSVLMVLTAELINTGVEYVVDRIGAEYHELSGKAKDIVSAAVLLALLNLALVWALVLFF